MSSEWERYEAFVSLSEETADVWPEMLASRFPTEPETQAEVLILLMDAVSPDADTPIQLPLEFVAAGSTCLSLLARLSRKLGEEKAL